MELYPDDLRRYSFFSSLSESSLEALAGSVSEAVFPAGSYIVREGETGDAFYFVKHGRLEVTKKTKFGPEAKLSVIVEGQGFGEMALLTCSIRSSSVRAVTDATLYKIEKAVFEDVVINEASFKYALYRKSKDHSQFDRIKTLQPFALLEPEKMHIVMEKLTEKRYAQGEDIIVQGEKGDNYYIIKSGLVAVLKKKKDENEYKQIAVLSDGEAFGEEALIRDDPRNATCRAMEDTTVLVLNKKDFSQILKGAFIENIFPEDIAIDTCLQDYVIIDARIPPEYEEEHIYGAVNIPVEDLRQKCAHFDKTKKYIAYCLNDSRGMVAAFLLKNRGFDAKCLRGGMSGWLGQVVTGSDGIHMPEKP
ncbi:MAG: cyclic nucleotide-binding domain-containing protein [Nitrospirae bacterium]|nr:cyclic nucleotide-binding domain-containing protein [Nitrospirota bacterium]